jgi:3-oxoacyl-(acyl-carrier-protein) synthase
LIGHTQGAASAIEALVTALTLDRQVLPPTINQDHRDPECDLDYIPNEARVVDPCQPLRYALTHSSGFGGINTALVLARDGVPHTARTIAPRRVVVTGFGAVTPSGVGTAAFWQSICAGRLALEPFVSHYETDYPLPSVGQVKDFRSEDYLNRKVVVHTDRMTHFAFAAVQEAIRDAGLILAQEDPQRIGTVIANTCGGIGFVAEQIERLYLRGPRFVSAHTSLAWLHVANVGRISIQNGLQGYGKVPVNDTCGGLDALGLSYQAIRRGEADVLIAGGTESLLHPGVLYVLGTSPAFSMEASSSAYRPFDQRASGLLIAEGAGVCILEEYEHAIKRGAPIYGEIVAYAQAYAPVDPVVHALSGPTAYIRALQCALVEAHMTPEDIACIFPDGCALPAWDANETTALREVLGSVWETLPCSVPRTQYGHSLAAAGVLDTISALLSLRERRLPPTLNCEQPDLSYAPPGLVRVGAEGSGVLHSSLAALVCARGLNGSHVVLALKRDVE